MTTKEAIEQVLAHEPDLSLYGYRDEYSGGPYSNYRGEFPVEKFQKDREAMLGDCAIREFECACEWLDQQPRTKNPNRTIGSSYTLKHMAEKEVEVGYIPNGIFIAAAIARGFKITRPEDGPNVWINISSRAGTEFDKRERERRSQRVRSAAELDEDLAPDPPAQAATPPSFAARVLAAFRDLTDQERY
jgi:hypothetical protein